LEQLKELNQPLNGKKIERFIMKKIILCVSISCLILGFSSEIFALDIVPSNSNYYYNLGGGSAISMPPVTRQRNITLGGDTHANLGFTCNGFNPAISVKNYLNNMGGSVQGMDSDILMSLTAAIGGEAMLLLEKADPELYNYIQNSISSGTDKFNMSLADCNNDLNDVKHGKSPMEDWVSISDSQGWLNYAKAAQQDQPVDANAASKEVTKNQGQYGVPWVHKGQNSGGSKGAQVPIRVIYDVAVAGYNVLVDSTRALDDQSTPPDDSNNLTKYWKKPDEVGLWTELVLGDINISSKEADDKTHPGVGLTTILETCPSAANNDLTCAKNIKQKLADLIAKSGTPSAEELKAVSSNSLMMTPDVIAAIRNKSAEDRAVSINALAEDIAIQNLIDEALLLRRVLIAGSQTKPVQNLAPALTAVKQTIHDLDQDIQNVMFEHDVKQKMTNNTVQTILGSESINKNTALSEHDQTQQPALQNGAIYKGNSL
jgi:integrating conjugative element protein (TIGR03755 family)